MCNTRWHKHRKNKGFSLVEVLVAVAILALVAIPLAQSLISSAQINSKTKNVGVASDMTTSVVESMQAVQLGDVLTEINGYTTDNVGNPLFDRDTGDGYSFLTNALKGYNSAQSYEVMMVCAGCNDRVMGDERESKVCEQCSKDLTVNGAVIYKPVTKQEAAGVISDADVTSAIKTRTTRNGAVRTYFTGNEDDTYDFVLRDISTDEASFDVLVHVEPKQTLTIANINSIDKSSIVNMVQGKNMETTVAEEFYSSHLMYVALHPGTTQRSALWFQQNMTRVTQVDVRQDAVRDAAVITVKNTYTAPNNTVASSDQNITKVVGSYTTNSTAELAQGVYYYFYPVRNNGTQVRDTIQISNPEGMALNIFLISMEDGDNTEYTPELEFINSPSGESLLTICSNMAQDQWDEVPAGVTIKTLGNMSDEQTMYNVDVTVYTHKEDSFENDVFAPKSNLLLVSTNATLLDSSERFDINVDSEIRNPIPEPEDPDNPNPPAIDPDPDVHGFADANSRTFYYDGTEHSVEEDNGQHVVWTGTTSGTDAGTYIAYATPTPGNKWPNGSTGTRQIIWYILRDPSAKAEPVNSVYDKQPHTGVIGEHVILSGDVTKTDAGRYIAYATPDSNHAWEDGTFGTKTIIWILAPRPITLTWEIGLNKDFWYYDGLEHHGNCIIGNIVAGDTVTPNYKDNSIKEIGSKEVTITSLSNPNYELPQNDTKHTISIIGANVATITMKPNVGTDRLVYNGKVQTGIHSSEGVSISGQDTAVDAGTYVITATPLPGWAWDREGTDVAPRDFTWEIYKKKADVLWGNLQWVYDGLEHYTTCKVINIDEYTPCDIDILNNSIVNVGQQPVTAVLKNPNYEFNNPDDSNRTLIVTTANDAWYYINPPVVYDERVHNWGKGEHIKVTGTLEHADADTYTVTIVPNDNHAWADGTRDAKTETWTIEHAKLADVVYQRTYTFTGRKILGVKLVGENSALGTTSKYVEYGTGTFTAMNNGTYTVQVTPKKNYAWIEEIPDDLRGYEHASVDGSRETKTVTWMITEPIIPEPTGNPRVNIYVNLIYEYNGQLRSPTIATIDGAIPLNDPYWDNHPYFQVKAGSVRTATNVGTYSFTIELKDKINYRWTDGTTDDKTFTWQIIPRAITIETLAHKGTQTYVNEQIFPTASTTADTKEVAYRKVWDGKTFADKFNVTHNAGGDLSLTKDELLTYHYQWKNEPVTETTPLAANQTIHYTIDSTTNNFSTAGTCVYKVTAIIRDASGTDVTSNYDITYIYSYLMIDQAQIKLSDIVKPVPNTLTYNKNNQDLAQKGSCIYGTLHYTKDMDANNGDTLRDGAQNKNWSTTMPQGKLAGQYKVYWIVDADQNHYDWFGHPNDYVNVTIKRAAQNIVLSPSSMTFCHYYISRTFGVSREENAPLSVTANSSAIGASISGTTVTASSKGTITTATITVNAAQVPNYLAGSATFTATLCNHNWTHDYITTPRPNPDCTKNGTCNDICTYGCAGKTTHDVPPLAHNLVYGGTSSNHRWCSGSTKCGQVIEGNSYHRYTSKVIKAATCESGGTTRYTCACGYYYDKSGEPAATGHGNYGYWEAYGFDSHRRRCNRHGAACGYWDYRGHNKSYTYGRCCGHKGWCTAANCGWSTYSKGGPNSHGHAGKTKVGNMGYKCSCCGTMM